MNKIIKKLRKEVEKELLELKEREEVIPSATVKGYKEREIAFAEDILDVIFPQSFRKFLLKKERIFINKQEILGLPTDQKTLSILEATKLLRIKRPDLPYLLIVISLTKNQALCLDIRDGNKADASIVEVSFGKNSSPVLFSKSFKKFLTTGEKALKQVEIKNLKKPQRIRIIR